MPRDATLVWVDGVSARLDGSCEELHIGVDDQSSASELTLLGTADHVWLVDNAELVLEGASIGHLTVSGSPTVRMGSGKNFINTVHPGPAHGMKIVGNTDGQGSRLEITDGSGFKVNDCHLVVAQGGWLHEIRFNGVRLTAHDGAKIDATGNVHISIARDCLITGDGELEITGIGEDTDGFRRGLENSVVSGIRIDRTQRKRSRDLVLGLGACARVEFVLDDLGSTPWRNRGLNNRIRREYPPGEAQSAVTHRDVAELTHELDDLARKKSRLGKTRTQARQASLRYRSAEARGAEGWLLKGYRLVGFGQTLFLPFLAWLAGMATVLVWALNSDYKISTQCETMLSGSTVCTQVDWWELLAGLVLAPVSLFRGSVGSEGAGLPFDGSGLLLARAAIGIPALILATAIVRTTASRRID